MCTSALLTERGWPATALYKSNEAARRCAYIPHHSSVPEPLGVCAIRATSVLPAAAPDDDIVAKAIELGRAVLTQDLDFSDIVALSGKAEPSLITLRLSDSRVENVNRVLASVLPTLEEEVDRGIIATVEDNRVRTRRLPV